MTHKDENSLNQGILELFANEGLDGMSKAAKILLNAAMLLEREKYLCAAPHERTEERRGYANGFKSKTIHSRIGQLELAIPQTRDSQFYPNSLEKGLRSERALKSALAEMYLQGVSTRKVAKITEEQCGFSVSSTQVSNATKLLDEELEQWRNRPLGCFKYLILDARYEKVRHGGSVIDCAILNAQSYAPRQDMKSDVAQEIRRIFNCGDRPEANRLLNLAVEHYSKTAPKLSEWMETSQKG